MPAGAVRRGRARPRATGNPAAAGTVKPSRADEASAARIVTGLANDGDIAGEPGTGAFFAETDSRGQPEAHFLQLIAGRPGFNGPRT